MYGHFDFGLITNFVSTFFLSQSFMEKGTAQWSHLPAGHVFTNSVGIKNLFACPILMEQIYLL